VSTPAIGAMLIAEGLAARTICADPGFVAWHPMGDVERFDDLCARVQL